MACCDFVITNRVIRQGEGTIVERDGIDGAGRALGSRRIDSGWRLPLDQCNVIGH